MLTIPEIISYICITVIVILIFVITPIYIYGFYKNEKLKEKDFKEFSNKIKPGVILECKYYEENPFIDPYVSRIKILEVKDGWVKFEELIQKYAKDSNNIGYYSISELGYIGYNFV